MEKYDAIIIGGGIAGLSLGSELSKKHKILLIEKNVVGNSHKCWTTEKKIIEKAGLSQYISASFNKSFAQTFKNNKFYLYDEAVTVDDRSILLYFRDLIIKNNSIIKENCQFLTIIKRGGNLVTIKTSEGEYSSQLIVDCSGVDSLLTSQFEIYDRLFYCPNYGGIYDVSLNNDEICLAQTIAKGPPITWFDVFPINKSQIVIYTFQYLNNKIDCYSLKKQHEYNLKTCYLKDKLKDKKMRREIYGLIPFGLMKKHAVDNIFFFGDTCLLGAPIIGSGFTNILQHYKKFANHLSKNLIDNTLKEKDLDYNYSELELINRNLLLIVTLILVNANPQQLDLFFNVHKLLPNDLMFDTVFLRLTIEQLLVFVKEIIQTMGLEELAKILPKKEYMFIAKEAIKIFEEMTIEKIEEIFHKYHEAI